MESALRETAEQVAEIRCEIRRLPVRSDDNSILLLVVRLTEPQRAIALFDVARLTQRFDGALREARLPQAVLVVPLVVADVQPGDRSADTLDHLVDRVRAQLRLRLFLGQAFDPGQAVARHPRGLGDGLACMAPLRRLLAVESRIHRPAETPGLWVC